MTYPESLLFCCRFSVFLLETQYGLWIAHQIALFNLPIRPFLAFHSRHEFGINLQGMLKASQSLFIVINVVQGHTLARPDLLVLGCKAQSPVIAADCTVNITERREGKPLSVPDICILFVKIKCTVKCWNSVLVLTYSVKEHTLIYPVGFVVPIEVDGSIVAAYSTFKSSQAHVGLCLGNPRFCIIGFEFDYTIVISTSTFEFILCNQGPAHAF